MMPNAELRLEIGKPRNTRTQTRRKRRVGRKMKVHLPSTSGKYDKKRRSDRLTASTVD